MHNKKAINQQYEIKHSHPEVAKVYPKFRFISANGTVKILLMEFSKGTIETGIRNSLNCE